LIVSFWTFVKGKPSINFEGVSKDISTNCLADLADLLANANIDSADAVEDDQENDHPKGEEFLREIDPSPDPGQLSWENAIFFFFLVLRNLNRYI
jgi:hypothetical protein